MNWANVPSSGRPSIRYSLPGTRGLSPQYRAGYIRQDIRRDTGILSLGGKQVPPIQRRRMKPDDGLPRIRLRLEHVLVNELVGAFEFVQTNGFHVAPFGRF